MLSSSKTSHTGPGPLARYGGALLGVYGFVPAEHVGASLVRVDPVGRALYLFVGTISVFLIESLRMAKQRADLHAAASSQLAAIVSSSEDAITGKSLEGIITS